MLDKIVNAILDGIKDGSLVQGILTIGLVGFYALIIEQGKQVPPELPQWAGLVIGFYFGGKAQGAISRLTARQSGDI